MNDAHGLLQYDPAGVEMRQVVNAEILYRLKNFASKLAHYVELAKSSGNSNTDHNSQAVDQNARALQVAIKQEEDQETTGYQPDVVPSESREEQAEEITTTSEEPLGPAAAAEGPNATEIDTLQEEYGSHDTVTQNTTEQENNNGGIVKEENGTRSRSSRSIHDANNEQEEPSRKRQCLESEQQPRNDPGSTTARGDINMRPEAPPPPPPSHYDGSLAQTQLEHSVGLNRLTLNQHLVQLGLTSKFSVGVVSKSGARVSHLTFNPQWNELFSRI